MKNKIVIAFLLALPIASNAQTFKVEKVKGNRAIVLVTSGSVMAGDTVSVSHGSTNSWGGSSSTTSSSSGGGGRDNVITLSGEFSNLSNSASSSSSTIMALSGRYGWNKSIYEFGGIGSFSSTSSSGTSTSTYAIGGFGDYNLTENRPGTDKIFGVGGTFTFGSATATGSTTSTSYMEFFGGGFGKFWLLGTTTAIRGDVGYKYQKMNSTPAATISGITAMVGLSHYF